MAEFQEYPKFVPVDGPGHPDMPGYVLVSNEDEERDAKAKGTGPAALNPPPNPGQKSLDEMDRDELKQVLLQEGIPDDMTDDEIRAAIRHGREKRAKDAEDDAEQARKDREAREAGGDHGDGAQGTLAPKGDAEAGEDAAGDKIAPDPADEANKTVASDPTRTAPAPKAAPGNDLRPDDAQDKQADDKPAGNVTEQAATPPSRKRGSSDMPGK